MSMIYCSGCGQQIHSSAESCPNCGAKQVGTEKSQHSKGVLALVCFFLGYFGIHRFMVGKVGTGILMILTFGGLSIWVIIDFIMILAGSFRDSEGRLVGS